MNEQQKPQCPKCLEEGSPASVENVSVGNGDDLWICHECRTVFKPIRKMGRPSMGITKKVSITLPEEDWDRIEDLKTNRHIDSLSEYFRNLHEKQTRK